MRNSTGDGAGCGRLGRGERRLRRAAHLNGAAGDRGGQRQEDESAFLHRVGVGVSQRSSKSEDARRGLEITEAKRHDLSTV